MNILYHQYGIGPEYGEDHHLTDNWNPDLDYRNEYVRVYFNIDTPSYNCNSGFSSPKDRDNWNTEASNLIKSFGILEDSGYQVEHSDEKCAYLYPHPHHFSGVILKNDVKKIAEAISQMKLSSIRWVDLHETVYVLSDEEYGKYLEGKKEEIRKLLFEKSATNRTVKYYDALDVARIVAKTIRLRRLGIGDGRTYGVGQTAEYILDVAKEMVREGYLKSVDERGRLYIRSLNKTEQKKSKLKMM